MLDFAERRNDGYARLREVAERQGISKAYLEQIMVVLNKENFFMTARGYLGGYQLARDPSEYTVGDILRVTEGSLSPVDENAESKSHVRTTRMADSVWDGLEDAITDYLDSITLSDILDAHREDDGLDYAI
jgi:Rrf2 family protein